MPDEKLEMALTSIATQLKTIHQEKLVSFYALKKRSEHHSQFSGIAEITLLLILEEEALDDIGQYDGFQKYFRDFPFKLSILTRSELEKSLDVFPLEFNDIKQNGQLIEGSDILGGLSIHADNMRHECEFYLRSYLISLREQFSLNSKDAPVLIRKSFPSFLTTFKHLIVLWDRSPQQLTAEEVIQTLDDKFGLQLAVLPALLEEKTDAELARLFPAYLEELANIIKAVDRYDATR